MGDVVGDALRHSNDRRTLDDPAVAAAARQLARDVSLSQAAPKRDMRPRLLIGLVPAFAFLGCVAAAGSALYGVSNVNRIDDIPPVAGEVLPSSVPFSTASLCFLETRAVPASGRGDASLDNAIERADGFLVASGTSDVILKTYDVTDSTETQLPGLESELVQSQAAVISAAVKAAGYLPSTVTLDFTVRCGEDPPQ